MTETAAETTGATPDIRVQILEDPSLILDDHELMRALLAADRSALGRNVVDLRGVLVDRLEERLDRLEDTHREVLAAAYENVAGTNQVHRACLALLEPADFAGFLRVLTREVAPILAVEVIRLGLEGDLAGRAAGRTARRSCRGVAGRRRRRLCHARPRPRGAARDAAPARRRLARPLRPRGDRPAVRGAAFGSISARGAPGCWRSAPLTRSRFHPDQGTDLLAFLGGVFERSLRRWLA